MFQPGQTIQLQHFPSQTVITAHSLKVEERKRPAQQQAMRLYGFRSSATSGCLRIAPDGTTVDMRGGEGPWATFELLQNPQDPSHFLLSCIGHKAQGSPKFLAFSSSSSSFSSSSDINSPDCRWSFIVVANNIISTASNSNNTTIPTGQVIQQQQKQQQAAKAMMTANPIKLKQISEVLEKNSNKKDDKNNDDDDGDESYGVDFEDGGCIRLVSLATGLCLPFPMTVEVTSQQHVHALEEIMYEKFNVPQGTKIFLHNNNNNNSSSSPSENSSTILHLRAHDNLSSETNSSNTTIIQKEESQHLRMLPNAFDTKGGRGPFATWEVVKTRSGLLLRNMYWVGPSLSEHRYLSISTTNQSLAYTNSPNSDETAYWMIQKAKLPLTSRQSYLLTPKFMEDVDFTQEQRECFRQNGYVIFKNAIQDPSLVEGALRFLNHWLGQGPKAWKFDEDKQKHVIDNSSHHSVVALYRASKIPTLLQRMLGKSNVPLVSGCQLALRFPVVNEFDEDSGVGVAADEKNTSQVNWHIDGQDREGGGNILPFSCLVKIALSDQTKEGCGNFTVFPGSHRRKDVIEWYHGVTQKKEAQNCRPPRPSLEDIQPLQVCLAPGDAVFVHPYLCHRVGSNVSPNIRYSTIVRIHAKDLLQVRSQPTEKFVQDPVNWFFKN